MAVSAHATSYHHPLIEGFKSGLGNCSGEELARLQSSYDMLPMPIRTVDISSWYLVFFPHGNDVDTKYWTWEL